MTVIVQEGSLVPELEELSRSCLAYYTNQSARSDSCHPGSALMKGEGALQHHSLVRALRGGEALLYPKEKGLRGLHSDWKGWGSDTQAMVGP